MTDPPPPPSQTRRRPSRRQAAIALVALVAVVAGVAVAVAIGTRHTAPATTTATTLKDISTEDQLDDLIRTRGLTPERAEVQFALDVGPLPGVSISGIKPNGGLDGSVAVLDLFAVWDQLTQAQRNAATQLLTPSITARVTAERSARHSGASPGVRLMNYSSSDYSDMAYQANLDEAVESGAPHIPSIIVGISNDSSSKVYALTWLYHMSPGGVWQTNSDGCHITVYDKLMQQLDVVTASAVMAHEVWHCYEYREAGSGGAADTIHGWIMEGESDWVMDQLYPANTYTIPWWQKYGTTPDTLFAARDYDAVGVFGHAGDIGGGQASVWARLLSVVQAGIGGQDSTALQTLLGAASDHYYSAWGASYFFDQSHVDWHMGGPGDNPPKAGPAPQFVEAAIDTAVQIGDVGPYQSQFVSIKGASSSPADILVLTLGSGYGEVHDGGYMVQQTLDTSAPLSLCMREAGCTCPDGSAGASLQTIPAQYPVSVGLNGGNTSLAAYARGDSLARYCKDPKDPPPATSGPGGGGGSSNGNGNGNGVAGPPPTPTPSGRSWGDPHYATFDGKTYDMQVAGEFTLVKSAVDDFTVQTRTVPLPDSQRPVAVNQAVAVRLNGHRVTFTLENGNIVLRLDGVVDDYTQQTVGQGSLTRLGTEAGTGYVVEWPDGTTLRVDQLGIHGLNVSISAAPDRMGKLVGLLGNDNGSASTDFVTPQGTSIGATPTTQVLDGQYADSWRVTQTESLFDYLPGQSTATFTNLSFPSSYVDAGTIPGAAQAKQQCEADGITDQYLLADCIVDASSIPDQTVLTVYAQAQVVQTVQYNLAHNLPAFAAASGQSGGGSGSSASPTTPTPNLQGVLVDSGTVADPAEAQAFSFRGQAGEIIWIGNPGCDDSGLTFGLVDPNGNTLNAASISMHISGCVAGLGRFVLPATGTYQLVANADHMGSGSYGLPIRVVRPDVVSQISYGQSVSGTISETAAHDVYTFQAHAGDIIELGGSGCIVHPPNNPFPVEVISTHEIPASEGVPAHKDQVPMDCGSPWSLQLSDTYEIIVNAINVGGFQYQFQLLKQ
jgi:von Willebrand factor type D domain